jgi:hypothetical protein
MVYIDGIETGWYIHWMVYGMDGILYGWYILDEWYI